MRLAGSGGRKLRVDFMKMHSKNIEIMKKFTFMKKIKNVVAFIKMFVYNKAILCKSNEKKK